MNRRLPVIVLGGGGHARVLLDTIRLLSMKVLGVTDTTPKKIMILKTPIKYLGTDETVFKEDPKKVILVNGMGSIGDTTRRMNLFCNFKSKGYTFASIVHPSAVIGGSVELGEGAQIMAGVVVQTGCKIGKNVVINTRASVDHDGIIEDHVFIAPGAIVSGGVRIGAASHLGPGVVVIQGKNIGKNCFVKAQSLIKEDLPDRIKQ